VHTIVYVVFTEGLTATDPEAAFAPLHPPEAVHPVALVEDHVSVEPAPPKMIGFGFESIVAVGTAFTVISLLKVVELTPIPEVQYIEYVVEVVGETTSEPDADFAPVNPVPPLAVQVTASVDVQLNVVLFPIVMVVNVAVRFTVGVPGAGGVGVTVPANAITFIHELSTDL
jgi:hypothetical protein